MRPLSDLWRETAAKHAGLTALIVAEGSDLIERITWKALDNESDELVAYLQTWGIRPLPVDRIAVDLSPSPAEIVVLVAILKCGAIYVPLHPLLPRESRQRIIKESEARILICTSDRQIAIEDEIIPVLFLDRHTSKIIHPMPPHFAALPSRHALMDLQGALNMLPTSGSTGLAKLVVGRESSFVHRIQWMHKKWPFVAGKEMVLRRTPLAFVDSVWEIWGTLLSPSGTALLIPDVDLSSDPLCFWDTALLHHSISRMTVTPSLLSILLHSRANLGPNIRLCICSGEPLTKHLAASFFKACPQQVRLLNLYGSTEVSGDCIFFELDQEALATLPNKEQEDMMSLVPLGQPLPGTTLKIEREKGEGAGRERVLVSNVAAASSMDPRVDEQREEEVEGELVVEGPLVSMGYYRQKEDETTNRDENNQEKEAFHRDAGGILSFRTRDWVCWKRASNLLCYRGRRDGLVKLRGVRTSLEEVSLRISEALGLETDARCCIGVAKEGDGLLLAITADAAAKFSSSRGDLWRRLQASLPTRSMMMPSRIVIGAEGEALPMTISGKLDRRALLEWGSTAAVEKKEEKEDQQQQQQDEDLGSAAPDLEKQQQQSIEKWIQDKYVDLLGNKEGRGGRGGGSLFARGGHSLLAMQALAEFRTCWGVELVMEDLALEVRDLAEMILRKRKNGGPSELGKRIRMTESTLAFDRTTKADLVVRMEVIWRYDLGKCVDGQPLIVENGDDGDSLVIAGSHAHVVAAVSVKTGEERWRTVVGGRVEGAASVSHDGRLVFVGCYDGKLYAFQALTGEIAWSFLTKGEIKCTPLVVDDVAVVIGSYDGIVYILHQSTGALLGQRNLQGSLFAAPVLLPRPPASSSSSSLAIRRIILTITNRGSVRCWRHVEEEDWELIEEWVYDCQCAVFTTPVLAHNRSLLIVGGTDGCMRGLDTATGGLLWTSDLKAGPIFASPALMEKEEDEDNDEAILIGCHDGSVRKLTALTGEVVWTFSSTPSSSSSSSSAAAVIDGKEAAPDAENRREATVTSVSVVHGISKKGKICLVVRIDGRVQALDVDNGELLMASLYLGNARLTRPAVAQVDVEGAGRMMVMFGSRDDGLYGTELRCI